jgi:hypothetical protein
MEMANKKKTDDVRIRHSPHAFPGMLDQAKIASQNLTGSHEWNVFLQRVQALIDQERRLLTAMSESMAIPNLTSDQVLQAHRHMLATKARIEAWEQVISLPKEILETANQSVIQTS